MFTPDIFDFEFCLYGDDCFLKKIQELSNDALINKRVQVYTREI